MDIWNSWNEVWTTQGSVSSALSKCTGRSCYLAGIRGFFWSPFSENMRVSGHIFLGGRT